jgi:tRNA 2-selenouridine synthase
MLLTVSAADALARLDEFDTIVDARSESEFALDRLPGAVNWPTLDDAQRHSVGTEYAQVSPFVAQKRGALMAARNIADHIERHVLDKPKDWRPLVYCWRGGKRSGALALVLDQVGFRVHRLEGGYQRYRRAVIEALDLQPQHLDWRVVCGSTGSGKSRLLQALREQGAQVVDLEALANHRGSVLGLLPGQSQPGQKQFESRLWDALRRIDPLRPVYVESESRKVGDLRVPPTLVERMHAAPCIALELGLEARVQLLIEDYACFVDGQEAARAGATPAVVRELLEQHYDPIYRQSMQRNFAGLASPLLTVAWDGGTNSLDAAAARIVAAN